MLRVGVGEIQKNSAIFSGLRETIQIVDKRRNKVLAMVYPMERVSVIGKLAGKYRHRVDKTEKSFDEIRNIAMERAMKEKCGLSS
jgi:hypothetical protein